jgi:DNA-binding GntR family transcriptional regulator
MGVTLKAVNQRPAREQVVETLRTAILTGTLQPGDRLVERDLAEQMKISRAPIREALLQLEQEGFVEGLPYRETRVIQIKTLEVQNVLVPTRTLLEVFALQQFMVAPDKSVFSTLEAIIQDMEGAALANDKVQVIEKDLEFHRTLMASTEYTYSMRIWSSITPVILKAFFLGTITRTLSETVEGHRKLLAVIRSGQQARAEQVLRKHIAEMFE